jgi:hypothetical protein
VLNEQVRRPKALLVFEVVGNNGLTGAQSIATRRRQIGPNTCHADYALTPANSGTNQKTVLRRYILQYFAVFRTQSFGCHTRGVIEHIDEARALKRKKPQFSKNPLLANALSKSASS